MNEKMQAIRSLDEKYGNVVFRMAIAHLFDVGARHLTDEYVGESLCQINSEHEATIANGKIAFMTPEFQHSILRCAAELSKHGVWDLFRYVKGCMDI